MTGKAGRSGRKPKPYGLKVLEGTAKPGSEPEVEFPGVDSDTPPYFVTNEHALREWDNLFPLLSATRVLTLADRTMLGVLCNTLADVICFYEVGQSPSASKLGKLQSLYSDFGLTPASRTRVKTTGEDKAKNPFEQLKRGA